jgi:amidase
MRPRSETVSELAYMTARDALDRFARRELSPVDLMQAVIDRAELVDPGVNALCHRFFDQALDQARSAEARYMGRGEPPRPLEGLPTAVKEEEPVAGQPWTQGSLIFADLVAEQSSCFAERILDSGAIVHARTTAPEFSCAGFTHSRIWGVTRNPWNPGFGVGGSSGGSGAALASGTTTLASGSDIAGSIRIPASFTGVVGFKPPYGRVPQMAPFNLDTYCHCGPMARTVADCLLFENALAGPHPADTVSLRPKLVIEQPLAGVDGLRIALSPSLGAFPLDPEVDRNCRDAAEALRSAGAVVDEVDLALDPVDIQGACAVHFHAGWVASIADLIAQHPDLVTAYAATIVEEMARRAQGLSVPQGLEMEARMWAPLGELFERYDALICATCGTRGLVAGDDYADHGLRVGDVDLDFYFESLLTPVFNIASRCPVLSVPSGFADNGVPTGIQIATRTYDDATAFRVGAALERERPWLDAPERRPRIGPSA